MERREKAMVIKQEPEGKEESVPLLRKAVRGGGKGNDGI